MTYLEEVSGYFPPLAVPVASLGGELGLDEAKIKVFQRFYGLSSILREPGGLINDLLLGAAGKLEGLRGREHRVRYVIQARTMPVVAPYGVNPVHEVKRELGLHNAVAFAMFQHACASGLFAVDLAGHLLEADGDPAGLALVLTGEKTFTPAAKTVPGTAINGEGSAAVLVGPGEGHDHVLSYQTRTYGQFNAGLSLSQEVLSEFQRVYPDALAEILLAAVREAGLTLDDLNLVLPHNVNRVSWVRVAKRIGLPLDRIFLDNVPVTGHCFCADPFLNYTSARGLGRLKPGDHYLMAAVGLGATFSAMVFRH
jgi:3-oxoacyl-[acyl-carrier-protein] synthase-3